MSKLVSILNMNEYFFRYSYQGDCSCRMSTNQKEMIIEARTAQEALATFRLRQPYDYLIDMKKI